MKIFSKLFKGSTKSIFINSSSYWEKRYSEGRTSGSGSYGKLAEFKAQVINDFVLKHNLQKIVEFGSGDGNQLKLALYPSYVGYDVSRTALERCRNIYDKDETKVFKHTEEYSGEVYDLSLSLDVIYHLVEDDVFENYMRTLFSSSSKFIIIYSSNSETMPGETKPHVRQRKFSDWIDRNEGEWMLVNIVKNKYPDDSNSDFFIYEKVIHD